MRKTRETITHFSNCGYFTNIRHFHSGVTANLIKLCIPKIS